MTVERKIYHSKVGKRAVLVGFSPTVNNPIHPVKGASLTVAPPHNSEHACGPSIGTPSGGAGETTTSSSQATTRI